MSFNNRLKPNQLAKATTGLSAGTPTGTGNPVPVQNCAAGSLLVAKVVMLVHTSSLVQTPSWQGSQDGTNWDDIVTMNNAANVGTAAGTGSDVTTTASLILPMQAPYKFVRAVVKTSGATPIVTADKYTISYHFVSPDFS